jgi:hypothetical protein
VRERAESRRIKRHEKWKLPRIIHTMCKIIYYTRQDEAVEGHHEFKQRNKSTSAFFLFLLLFSKQKRVKSRFVQRESQELPGLKI